MRKRPPIIEWHVAESDAEWDAMRAQPQATPPVKRYQWAPVLLLVLAMSMGGWWWQKAENTPPPRPPDSWGVQQRLTTPQFRFHFYERDSATVATVAPRLEQLYTTLQQNFAVALPAATPLDITIEMTRTLESTPYRPRIFDTITVPSPTLYPTTTWPADELLLQSLALPLLDHTLALVVRHHGMGAARYPLLDGLRLWQLWSTDLPLARWRPALVQWIYVALPTTATVDELPLPADYPAFCAAHTLWMAYPAQLHIPLLCTGMDESPRRLPYALVKLAPRSLPPLDSPIYPDEETDGAGRTAPARHPGYVIAVATVLDYVDKTYGRASVPHLVAGWGSAATWDDLTPALFGLPAAEFERGWQQFLTTQQSLTIVN